MNFGRLDRRIELQQYAETRTSSGSYTKTWTKLSDLWAAIEWKSGGENIEADQEQGFNTVNFTIRYCGSIKATEIQRIKYNDEYFDILYVNEIDRKKYQMLATKRKTVWQEK